MLNNIQGPVVLKESTKLRIKETIIDLPKHIYKWSTVNIILYGEILKSLPLGWGTWQWCPYDHFYLASYLKS